jgi:hypothetical protein
MPDENRNLKQKNLALFAVLLTLAVVLFIVTFIRAFPK